MPHIKTVTNSFTNPLISTHFQHISRELLLIPVVVDVLNVVVILQQIDELLHVLDVGLIGQGDVVLGDHLHENQEKTLKTDNFLTP